MVAVSISSITRGRKKGKKVAKKRRKERGWEGEGRRKERRKEGRKIPSFLCPHLLLRPAFCDVLIHIKLPCPFLLNSVGELIVWNLMLVSVDADYTLIISFQINFAFY